MEMANQQKLYRVGFEEIHKVWSDISYRPAFAFVNRIAAAGVPVFGTSGSLPEHLLSGIYEVTSIIWKVIRMPSNRKELVYSVREVPKGQPLRNAVSAYWDSVETSYRPEDRCLVFCRTVDEAKQLGELLGVHAYHRECEDDEPVQQLLTGTQKILPTTLKLGCGFHYPHIRDVIHLDLAYSITDQYQEDSRGGRDGSSCRAITFVQEGRHRPQSDAIHDLGADAVYEWATKKDQCYRIGPSLFLDNVAVTCLLIPGAQLCAYCELQCSTPAPMIPRRLPIRPLARPTTVSNQNGNRTSTTVASFTPASMSMVMKRRIESQTPFPSKRMRMDSGQEPNFHGDIYG